MMNDDKDNALKAQISKTITREYYLDYAKVSSIIFMILVHVFWKFGSNFDDPTGYTINYYLGGFMAAPVFMTAMGLGFSLTKNNDPKQFIERGTSILVLGYIFNFLRELPIAIYEIITSGYSTVAKEIWSQVFQGDILQFAGLAMILFGLFKKIKLSNNNILIIGCLMSLAGSLIPTIFSDSIIFNATAGLFIFIDYPEETIMCFPLLTWFVYPAFGYWISNALHDKEKTFKITLIPCFLIALIGSIYEMKYSVFMMHSNSEYYHMYSHDALISLCYVVFCFGFFFFVCKHLKEKTNHFISSLSNALNLIYIVHWLIISVLQLVFVNILCVEFSNIEGFCLTIVITLVSLYLGVHFKKIIKKKIDQAPSNVLRYLR